MNLGIKNWMSTPPPIENSGAVPLPVGECEAVHISYDIEKTDGVHHYERVNIIPLLELSYKEVIYLDKDKFLRKVVNLLGKENN